MAIQHMTVLVSIPLFVLMCGVRAWFIYPSAPPGLPSIVSVDVGETAATLSSEPQLLFLYFGFRMLKEGMESHGGPSEELTEVGGVSIISMPSTSFQYRRVPSVYTAARATT